MEAVFEFLHPDTVEHVLTQALLASPMFTARWRWNASRALAIPRFLGGRKVPPPIQRMRAEDLLAAVFPDQVACAENLAGEIRIPDHPLVNETIDNCLHEAMDIDGLKSVLAGILSGKIVTRAVETPAPSVFSHEILNANPYAFLDDAPLEERRTRAVQLRRTLRTELPDEAALLDPAAIDEVERDAWPVVRDADELHDALLTLIAVPPSEEWSAWFDELRRQRRATRFGAYWVAAERLPLARAVYPQAPLDPPIAAPDGAAPAPEIARRVHRRIAPRLARIHRSADGGGLAERLGLTVPDVDAGLARLQAEGLILQGRFRSTTETEWCNRRLLARIHRLTLGRLRREIEPVSTTDFVRFLLRWQHVAPGTELHGVDGVFQVVRQLQGYEIPAAAWESQILPRRIAHYAPEMLDNLCLSGEVMWGRLSPHPATEGHRVRPTKAAPISLFLREDADWLAAASDARPPLSHPAREVLEVLESQGASFFPDLTRASGRLPSEVEDALWELIAAGLVTADSFENLRALTDPKRRRGEGRGRRERPRYAGGRWAVLRLRMCGRHARRSMPASCSTAGASSSATSSLVKRSPRPGATSCRSSAAWKRAARSAAAASCRPSSAKPSPCRKPSTCCARSAATQARSKSPNSPPPTRSNVSGYILPGSRVSALAGGVVQLA